MPTQEPPYRAGSLIALFRSCVPAPQVLEQVAHALHSPHVQSIGDGPVPVDDGPVPVDDGPVPVDVGPVPVLMGMLVSQ